MKRWMIVVALVLVGLPLAAQMGGGRMPGMRGTGDNAMMSGVTVGPDATAYVVRHVGGSSNGYELAAVRPSGTVAWTAPLDNRGAMMIAVNATTVFVTAFGTAGTLPNLTIKSQLIGFNATSGGKVFTNDLSGIAMDLTAYTDGVYLLQAGLTVPPGSMMSFGRQLVSVSNSGKVNFSLPLD